MCQQINQINGDVGWHTLGSDDWMYYPQQTGKKKSYGWYLLVSINVNLF